VPSHSGDNQFLVLLPTLQDYDIKKKLRAIIANNASLNNVLCRIIKKYM